MGRVLPSGLVVHFMVVINLLCSYKWQNVLPTDHFFARSPASVIP